MITLENYKSFFDNAKNISDVIYKAHSFDDDFIDYFADDLDWYNLSTYEPLSYFIIKKHQDKICWLELIRFSNLSNDLMIEFDKHMNWDMVIRYQTPSYDLISKHLNEINWDVFLHQGRRLPEDFLNQNIAFFKKILAEEHFYVL